MSGTLPIGVIFDMDGVLVDSAEAHFQSWQLLAGERGVKVSQGQFAATFGRQNRDIIPLLFGAMPSERLEALANRKEELYRALICRRPPIIEGARELILDLYRRGACLAVGSSGPRENIELVLSALAVRECIGVVVSGDDVSRGKPDPQVFLVAAERLGLPPDRCVVIEDAPVGVQAARVAGAKTVAVLMYHPIEAFDHPDLAVHHLADLAAAQIIALIEPDARLHAVGSPAADPFGPW